MAKRARKLAEASATAAAGPGQRSILSFARTQASSALAANSKQASSKLLLPILKKPNKKYIWLCSVLSFFSEKH
jgi:hypothetical protein